MNKKLIGILLFTLLFVGLSFTGLYYGYSDGQRTGDVYKFSRKGLFWKSWEGEMYLGGVRTSADGSLQVEKFYFSIPSRDEGAKSDLINKIQTCSENRETTCTIVYKQWFIRPAYVGSSYDVVDVILK